MMKPVKINGRSVGPGHPCFIIAEAGVNHNGKLELAKKLVDAAAEAGADAVKFQAFKSKELASAKAPKAAYQKETTDQGESQLEMLRKLELDIPSHRILMDYCIERGILFLSSPFDEKSADELEQLGVEAYKIPSGEITNLPFLARIATKGKPMIVSTGMSTLGEVEEAIGTIEISGNRKLILLQCVSNYPAHPKDVNLRAMDTMATAFNCPVGYSDHTQGIEVSLAAVAMGACVIEKHFTLDRDLPGPDHKASLEPKELAALVKGIRVVESAMGSGRKAPAASESDTAYVVRKSLVAKRNIPGGSIITEDMIAVKRPGNGLPPSMLQKILGLEVKTDIEEDTLISLEMFT
jgi:N-acetylneuraminate synthase